MSAILRLRTGLPWKQALCGISAGLYLSRLIAENLPIGWSLPRLALLLLVSLAVGLGLLLTLGRRLRSTPLLLLLPYALWPQVNPALALAVLFVALVALGLLNDWPRLKLPGWGAEVAAFAGSLTVYVYTLAPGLLPADSGEFQLVARLLGIAHPPGYPLYTMLGKLFTLLPLGDAAYRVNLLSAVAMALTLALLCRLVRRLTGSAWIGLGVALALGASPTIWAQATTANIRSLTALFTVAQMYYLHEYGSTKSRRDLVRFALAFGLGVGHHGSLGLLALPYGVYLLAIDRKLLYRWRHWAASLGAFALSLLALLYLPIRSLMGAPFDAAPIRSVQGFLDHVLARGFGGDMFAFARPDLLADRLPVLGNILVWQLGYPLLLVALAGFIAMLARQPKRFLLFGGVFLVNAFVAITYRAPQTVEYLIPAYLGLAALLGWGAHALGHAWPRRAPIIHAVVAALLLWLGLARLTASAPSYIELSRDTSTRDQAEALLREAPPNAMVLANWHQVTPLWYLQLVEGIRPDVQVDYVYPEGATPNHQVWARRIAEGLAQRPVLVTNYEQAFADLPYRFVPFGGAQQVIAGALDALPPGMSPLGIDLEGKVRLLAYQLAAEALHVGDDLVLRLAWQPLQPLDQDYSFFVHLVQAPGMPPLGQGDRWHPSTRYQVGEIIVDEYRLSVLPTAPAGRYTLLGGAYYTFPGGWQRLKAEDGQDAVALAEVEIAPLVQAPVTKHPQHLAFSGGLACVGVDYDHSVADALRVYLHWFRPEGLTGARDALLYRDGELLARGRIIEAAGYGTLALDVPPGDGALRLEVRTAPEDAPVAALGPWHHAWRPRHALPAPHPGERYVILGGEMALESAAWEADGRRVTLDFRALRPLTRDYSVSVSLIGAGGRLIAQHDTTPALGAIPTLKWIRGSAIQDLHILDVPEGDPGGEATLRLTVYDAFTLQPLAVADERLAREGQGTQMVLGVAPIGK
ncbi:MAG: DUF2723 domain-containing protein [Chloroflexi bacterium]|nr:DUF2723 domain-containing protein [Chloroflexota bacterium]